MKKIIIYSLILSVIFAVSCRKDDNPTLPDALARVPTPSFTKDKATDQVISAQEPLLFKASFSTDLFFKSDIKPSKISVVVIKNGNAATQKVLKADISSFPTSISITGPQLTTLFGADIVLGDKFDVGADITTESGTVFPAFPTTGVGYGSGVSSEYGGVNVFIRYEAVCKFDATKFVGDGNFVVVTDEWQDYGAGADIKVTKVSENQISFNYATTINVKPIVVTIDLASNEASVPKQAYGNYGTVDNFSAASTGASTDNFVAPCEGLLALKLNHTSQRGNFGDFIIQLKKK